MIENELISTPESRLLDFSPIRLGAAKNGKLTPSDFNSLVHDSPKRFRFLNPEQFGTFSHDSAFIGRLRGKRADRLMRLLFAADGEAVGSGLLFSSTVQKSGRPKRNGHFMRETF